MNKYRRLSTHTHNPLSSSQRASKSSWVVIVAMVAFTTLSALIFLLYQGSDAFLLQSDGGGGTKESTPSSATIERAVTVSGIEQLSAAERQNESSLSPSLRSEGTPAVRAIPASDSPTTISPVAESQQAPSLELTDAPVKLPATLVSLKKPVISDVRGNLGPPSVVTNEDVADWLKDRWQAARNMQGEPIAGEHWLEIDLESVYEVDKFLIDWEQAYSDQWTIVGRRADNTEWTTMAVARDAKTIERNSKHVIQEVSLPTDAEFSRLNCRYVRLIIHRSSTMWGSSVWRLQVWGRPGQLNSPQELARMERKRHERPVFRIKKAQH